MAPADPLPTMAQRIPLCISARRCRGRGRRRDHLSEATSGTVPGVSWPRSKPSTLLHPADVRRFRRRWTRRRRRRFAMPLASTRTDAIPPTSRPFPTEHRRAHYVAITRVSWLGTSRYALVVFTRLLLAAAAMCGTRRRRPCARVFAAGPRRRSRFRGPHGWGRPSLFRPHSQCAVDAQAVGLCSFRPRGAGRTVRLQNGVRAVGERSPSRAHRATRPSGRAPRVEGLC